ncbi:MAG: FHA domain-containing protein [Alphaproteobacteria bacterium]
MQTLSIGRSATNDIVVDHRTVSRKHAELDILDDGSFRLRDNDSANGTYVKIDTTFHRSAEAQVGEADIVRFGSFESSVANLVLLAQKRSTKKRRRRAGVKKSVEEAVVPEPRKPSERLNPLEEVRPTQPVGRMSPAHEKLVAEVNEAKPEKSEGRKRNTATTLIALGLVSLLAGAAFLAYWFL